MMVSTMATRHQKALSSSSRTSRAMAASLEQEERRPGVICGCHTGAGVAPWGVSSPPHSLTRLVFPETGAR